MNISSLGWLSHLRTSWKGRFFSDFCGRKKPCTFKKTGMNQFENHIIQHFVVNFSNLFLVVLGCFRTLVLLMSFQRRCRVPQNSKSSSRQCKFSAGRRPGGQWAAVIQQPQLLGDSELRPARHRSLDQRYSRAVAGGEAPDEP